MMWSAGVGQCSETPTRGDWAEGGANVCQRAGERSRSAWCGSTAEVHSASPQPPSCSHSYACVPEHHPRLQVRGFLAARSVADSVVAAVAMMAPSQVRILGRVVWWGPGMEAQAANGSSEHARACLFKPRIVRPCFTCSLPAAALLWVRQARRAAACPLQAGAQRRTGSGVHAGRYSRRLHATCFVCGAGEARATAARRASAQLRIWPPRPCPSRRAWCSAHMTNSQQVGGLVGRWVSGWWVG